MDLDSLLLDVQNVDENQLEQFAFEKYQELYINARQLGVHQTHDGNDVLFWLDRFEHAFRTSRNRARNAYAKDKLDIDRVVRMAWIRPVIAGEVPDSGCWEVAGEGRRLPPNRLYVVWPKSYIVWLEPRMNGGWKFSSAYSPPTQEIRRYCRGGKQIWDYGWGK